MAPSHSTPGGLEGAGQGRTPILMLAGSPPLPLPKPSTSSLTLPLRHRHWAHCSVEKAKSSHVTKATSSSGAHRAHFQWHPHSQRQGRDHREGAGLARSNLSPLLGEGCGTSPGANPQRWHQHRARVRRAQNSPGCSRGQWLPGNSVLPFFPSENTRYQHVVLCSL